MHVRRAETIKGDVYEGLNEYRYVWLDLMVRERVYEYREKHVG